MVKKTSWKIWDRQLGWLFPIYYGNIIQMFQTTNQWRILNIAMFDYRRLHTKFDSRNIPGTTGWFQMSNPSTCLWTAVNTIEIHWKHDTNNHTSIFILWTSLHFITTSLSNPILFHNSLTLNDQISTIKYQTRFLEIILGVEIPTGLPTVTWRQNLSHQPRSPVGWTVLIFLVSWCPKHHWFLYIPSWFHNFFHTVS